MFGVLVVERGLELLVLEVFDDGLLGEENLAEVVFGEMGLLGIDLVVRVGLEHYSRGYEMRIIQ